MLEYAIGVDLGGTQIRAMLVDNSGQEIRRAHTLTQAHEGLDAVIERIRQTVRQAGADVDWREVGCIGVGAPGPLDPWRGIVFEAPNLPGWIDVPLKALLEDSFQVPVQVGNDANVAALGEHRFGAGQDVDDLIYVTVSTGIGGGIISQGQLIVGAHGLGGEVGHITVEAGGPPCNCGNTGCVETLASGPAIAREAVARIQAGATSQIVDLVGGDLGRVTAETVTHAAGLGDQLGLEIVQRAGFYIGVAFVSLIHIFNPRLFLLGGGVSQAGNLLFDPIRTTVRERAMPPFQRDLRIEPAGLGQDAGLWGAVALALGSQK
ncbi:MAG: hypothetical protein A2Z04_09780 [Chloroflexi bacterium RBG_16_57_9]|nr:MAG: hypothetical protein A2Z04_09780 [Chloroflexi bacterium RBG_16_57_9]